jgi:DNA modification methylase
MELKQIHFDTVKKEWDILAKMTPEELENVNGRSRLGCDIVDYYFFEHRLKTKGNKGINFYEFVDQIEFYKTKPYIQTLLAYCDKKNRYKDSDVKRYYYIYGLTFGRINAFKITNALKMYHRYKPKRILDPFCGFGGRLAAALMLDIPYVGLDINVDLKPDYERLMKDFGSAPSTSALLNTCIKFQDCNTFDYSSLDYDMVFTSPPYENIEVYPNNPVRTVKEWDTFYREIFRKLWDNLHFGGIFAINIHKKIYDSVLVDMFGECNEKILLTKSSRNEYIEYIYVWVKYI